MTAETLKPFITPPSVDNFPATHSSTSRRRQRSGQIVAIGLGVTAVLLATVLLGFTIWNSICIFHLKAEVKHLNHIVESMQNRLGLHYLDDLQDFEKEYSNAVFENPTDDIKEDDDDDEDDDDEEDDVFRMKDYDEMDDSYDELIKKYNSYDDSDEAEDETEDVEEPNISDDDNLYDDFEKFKDSKQKRSSRKTRSIQHTPHELPVYEESYLAQLNKTASAEEQQGLDAPSYHSRQQQQQHQRTHRPTLRPQSVGYNTINAKGSQKRHIVAENFKNRRTELRPRGQHRRRKIPVVKSGDSLLSAKSAGLVNSMSSAPAAHFHLNKKLRDRYAVDAYPGDIYIGHRSRANELATEHYFKVDAGVLSVREPGLYYVYAQVCYNNTHDQNGFVIFHGHKAFLQCLNTVPTNMPKLHTCHTSGLIHLGENETIHLRDFHSDRNAILKDDNNRSYFGIIKI